MRTFALILFVVSLTWLSPAQEPAARFFMVDVFVDSGTAPLAAYQADISATNGAVKIVGIEGGEPLAFRNAPYYDPAAMQGERVVLGAFTTNATAQLPLGSTRVASVHCLVSGGAKPVFNAKVTAAATVGGQPISVQINVKERAKE